MIEAGKVFQQVVFKPREVRAQMDGLLRSVEQQRLIAWARWIADTEGTDEKGVSLKKTYDAFCREQARLMAGVERWKVAHPEEVEEPDAEGEE